MSEKRFVLKFNSQENEYFIRDNFEEEEELGSYTLKWGVRKLNEQQATIKKLQDLCGESDGENAKLRIENKKLKEENEQLKYDNFMFKGVIETFQKVAISERKKLEKENEQLRQKLDFYLLDEFEWKEKYGDD